MSTRPPQSLSCPGHALHCDEYELTMAQSYLRHGQTGRVAFELFVRTLPRRRGYLVAAGLEQALAYLMSLRFTDDDLDHLRRMGYDPAFVEHLAALRFSGDVDAIPEGTIVGAATPLLRIVAPRVEATVVESALLALINHQTLIASKTSRIVDAAAERPVWDFSLRRLHGPDAAVAVARAAYIAGAAGTSTVVAGRLLGIPTTGTMAHHYVLSFGPDAEQAAFEQFLLDNPGRAVALVDTYDTVRGVERAVAASRATGVPLLGIRLDSGDLSVLSRRARAILNSAGMTDTHIVASNDLDEDRIAELVRTGAPIDSFGVGTMLGTSADAPVIPGVYKLVAQADAAGGMQPVMKFSTDKATDPGIHQVFRVGSADVVGLDGEDVGGRPLMTAVMRAGRPCADPPSLDEIRERCRTDRDALPPPVRRLENPQAWPVRRSRGLEALREGLWQPAAAIGGGRR